MDINKIQSALQSLKEERAHIEDYLQNAATKKKELDKELNTHLNKYNCK
jgi:chromosome segregation ATPase